jgi:hypothetical protein
MSEAIERLADLGFDRADCAKALQVTPLLDLAAELISSGNISQEGLRALEIELGQVQTHQTTEEAAYAATLQSRYHIECLRAGLRLSVLISNTGGGTSPILVTPEGFDAWLRRTRGCGLAEVPLPADDNTERFFAAAYNRLQPQEMAAIDALVREGWRFPVVVRVFFGCDRNIAITHASLKNLFP